MTKYVALLRGINVGGKAKVPMQELKQVFESQGYQSVVTYINSGNVIFESDQSINDITAILEESCTKYFGFDLKILVIGQSLLSSIADSIPSIWLNNTEQKTDVLFLWDKIDSRDILRQFVVSQGKEHLVYMPGALVWNVTREFQNHSAIPKTILQKEIYSQITIRNINTVRKLIQLLYI
jgi:uncharacterized protein (DUF1697 family)